MPNDNTTRRRGKRKHKRYPPREQITNYFPLQKSDEKRGFANESSNATPNTNNNDAVTVLDESKVNHEAKCDPVLEWTEEGVKQWLHRLPDGLGRYSQNFVEAGVTGKYLVNHLTVDILESMKIKKMHALHLYEEICELRRKGIHSINDVRDYIQRHEHLLLPYATNDFKLENFTVKETHPFHEKVQNEAIPMGGYDCSQGHPNLLLWNLPQSTKQFKNDNPGVSWVLKVSQRILNGDRNHPLGVLFGVSGCGKSRTIFEVLSTRYGLYFEPYGSQQPGSPEMKPLESKIHMKAEYDKENLTSIATHLIRALVLTRLLLLFHCQRLACDASTTMQPRSWLFAQLRAPQLLTSNNLVLFTEVFEQLSKCHAEDVLDEVKDLLKKFVTDDRFQKPKSNLYVFTDEAHVLLKSCERKFVSRTAGDKGRALFSHFFKTLSDLDHMNIFLAGTALRLSDSQELMKSCIGKDTKEEDLVFHKFYRYDTDSKIQEYLRRFMSPGKFLKNIKKLFQGRPRFLACFVSHVLRHNATDKDEIIEESIHDAKTFLIGGKNIRDKRSLGYQLDQLDEQGRPTLVRVAGGRADVINLLEKLVVAYYLSNGTLLLPCPEEMNLVDRGICYVEIDNEHGCLTKAKITEPLVVIAIKKFFERIGIYSNIEEWVQDLLLNPLIGPQSRGALLEQFVPRWVRRSFNMQPIDVSTHPLFRGIKDLPPWLQNCRLWPGNGKSINCASATGTGKYLTEPKHQFVFPDSNAGPDLIFYLEELDSPVRSEGVTDSVPIGEFPPQITGSQPPVATLQSTVDSTMSGICKQFGDAAVSVDIPLSENHENNHATAELDDVSMSENCECFGSIKESDDIRTLENCKGYSNAAKSDDVSMLENCKGYSNAAESGDVSMLENCKGNGNTAESGDVSMLENCKGNGNTAESDDVSMLENCKGNGNTAESGDVSMLENCKGYSNTAESDDVSMLENCEGNGNAAESDDVSMLENCKGNGNTAESDDVSMLENCKGYSNAAKSDDVSMLENCKGYSNTAKADDVSMLENCKGNGNTAESDDVSMLENCKGNGNTAESDDVSMLENCKGNGNTAESDDVSMLENCKGNGNTAEPDDVSMLENCKGNGNTAEPDDVSMLENCKGNGNTAESDDVSMLENCKDNGNAAESGDVSMLANCKGNGNTAKSDDVSMLENCKGNGNTAESGDVRTLENCKGNGKAAESDDVSMLENCKGNGNTVESDDISMLENCKGYSNTAKSEDSPMTLNTGKGIFDVPSSCIIKQDNTDALSVTANGCYNCDEDASELLQYGEVLATCDTADMAGESNAVARLGQARGRLRLCLAQVKLSSDGKVSSNTAQHGKMTTDWRKLYDRTQKDGNPQLLHDRKDKAVAACKALQAEEGTLRILLCLPALARPRKSTLLKEDPIVSKVVGNDVFLVITLDNLADFGADESDLNLIRMITDPEIRADVAVKKMRM